ncbi:hypothetical protein Aple_070430 [Acrocarpospora pleiomorpha]|uniref:Uncharacterized protein n=1 Tax=Acrocarpospora pleiomorpha TaxID=90975 RepID=A0A5M3XSC1_9ACTN|nr:hypothetical protein [Acrocarpospora pleiomorpha]GES24144.1 hypothetical protein Aple_070430 [Acrocarpospora pleiomorpha]
MNDRKITMTLGDPFRGLTDKDPYSARFFLPALRKQNSPDYLAHHDHGWYEFAMDNLDDPGAGTGGAANRRSQYAAACKQLVFQTEALNGYLAEADTGRLIRVVLHAEFGALYCAFVVEKRYVLGIVFGQLREQPLPRQPRVRGADTEISRLATELRDDLGTESLNPGGWRSELMTVPKLDPEWQAAVETRTRERGVAEVSGRLAAVLEPYGLCYLARYREGEIVACADLLDHPVPKKIWGAHNDSAEPRARYDRITEEFGAHCAVLSQLARPAVRGRLLRIVLDVERGAIYYYRLGARDYLVGVTVNQEQVAICDDKMGDLASSLLAQ